jgi:hypothetical protein
VLLINFSQRNSNIQPSLWASFRFFGFRALPSLPPDKAAALRHHWSNRLSYCEQGSLGFHPFQGNLWERIQIDNNKLRHRRTQPKWSCVSDENSGFGLVFLQNFCEFGRETWGLAHLLRIYPRESGRIAEHEPILAQKYQRIFIKNIIIPSGVGDFPSLQHARNDPFCKFRAAQQRWRNNIEQFTIHHGKQEFCIVQKRGIEIYWKWRADNQFYQAGGGGRKQEDSISGAGFALGDSSGSRLWVSLGRYGVWTLWESSCQP